MKMRGTVIRATRSDLNKLLIYQVLWDVDKQCYRLLSLSSCNIMSGFKGYNRDDIEKYIEVNLQAEIISWSENNL